MLFKKRRYNVTGLKRFLYKSLVKDKRCNFYDLSRLNKKARIPQSSILNIYDRDDNIGNFLPVLGIRKMLGFAPDTWDIHDPDIDFDFINNNYQGVIIGGAGLLCPPFKDFWVKYSQQCHLPTVIWGVGSGLGAGIGEKINLESQDSETREYIEAVSEISRKCDLVNVRDQLTADFFKLHNVHIAACPTVVYMQEFRQYVNSNSSRVLYSSHHFDSQDEIRKIKESVSNIYQNFYFTENVQHPYLGLDEIIENYYVDSSLVVTTRLHGAIMAYGLGIPYVGITRGEKIRSFCNEYGNGILIENISQLQSILSDTPFSQIPMQPIAIEPVLDFGSRVKQWSSSLTTVTV
ncbi:MAG: polysaccharide pyruvyl transferase family protein [Cyanobacteria bacterium P01_C01_bin.72]